MMRKLPILLLSLSAVFFLLVETPAQAALMMKLETSSAAIVIEDNEAGDTISLPGIIGYTGSLGSWIMTSSTGFGSGAILSGQLHFDSVTLSGEASTIDIYLSQTSLSIPSAGWTMVVGPTLAAQGSALFEAYFDSANSAFGGTKIADLNFSNASLTQQSFAGSDTGYVTTPDDLYSLTIKARITHTSAYTVSSFNAHLTPVPVPPSLVLLGTGLISFIFFQRKRNPLHDQRERRASKRVRSRIR